MGSSLQWSSNIRAMVRGRENLTHKCIGTTSSKIGSIFLHQRKKGALSYLLKMGETKNKHMIRLNKEIWHYLLNHIMAITVEYLPSVLNTVADRKSRKKTDSPEWLFHAKVFQAVSRLLASRAIDIFDSRLCHQLPQYKA